MARRKRSKTRTVLVFCVMALAAFGGYTLWERYSGDVSDTADEVSKRAKKVKKAITD